MASGKAAKVADLGSDALAKVPGVAEHNGVIASATIARNER